MLDMTDEEAGVLRRVALNEFRVRHAKPLPPEQEVYAEAVIENSDKWPCGYDQVHFRYWCTPVSTDGDIYYLSQYYDDGVFSILKPHFGKDK